MKICQHISAVLAEPDVGTVSHLFLVGGFAESPLLQVVTMMMLMEMRMMNMMIIMWGQCPISFLLVGLLSHSFAAGNYDDDNTNNSDDFAEMVVRGDENSL